MSVIYFAKKKTALANQIWPPLVRGCQWFMASIAVRKNVGVTKLNVTSAVPNLHPPVTFTHAIWNRSWILRISLYTGKLNFLLCLKNWMIFRRNLFHTYYLGSSLAKLSCIFLSNWSVELLVTISLRLPIKFGLLWSGQSCKNRHDFVSSAPGWKAKTMPK